MGAVPSGKQTPPFGPLDYHGMSRNDSHRTEIDVRWTKGMSPIEGDRNRVTE